MLWEEDDTHRIQGRKAQGLLSPGQEADWISLRLTRTVPSPFLFAFFLELLSQDTQPDDVLRMLRRTWWLPAETHLHSETCIKMQQLAGVHCATGASRANAEDHPTRVHQPHSRHSTRIIF